MSKTSEQYLAEAKQWVGEKNDPLEQWVAIAKSLAFDLSVAETALGHAVTVIQALKTENDSLKENEALCNRDKCGYINEYKALLKQKNETLDRLNDMLNRRDERIRELEKTT